jgi:hypothetical protein
MSKSMAFVGSLLRIFFQLNVKKEKHESPCNSSVDERIRNYHHGNHMYQVYKVIVDIKYIGSVAFSKDFKRP